METVQDLIRDFSSKLGDIAGEFGIRADHIIASSRQGAGDASDSPAALAERARAIMALRKTRRRHFPAELFHEPAWEMLLSLFIVYETEHSMNVKALVACSDAPATTSQRWIDHLHKSGMINRVTDAVDRRRVDISLSDVGHRSMTAFLTDLHRPC